MTDDFVATSRRAVGEWMHALSEPTGSPGGGAGAAVMLGIAAALTSMVAGYTEAPDGREAQLDAVSARSRALRDNALRLADDDAQASAGFGAAFRLPKGPERDAAVGSASIAAAAISAALGERAVDAVDDLVWLGAHGNRALVADVVVACGALRAAIAGARTNVSFDLGSVRSAGESLRQIERENPSLWASVKRFDDALARLDRLTAELDPRAAPTDAPAT